LHIGREVEDLVGRQALFVIDLAPKKMVGKLSEGMRFDIGYAAGRQTVLAVPEKGGSQGMKEPMRRRR